MSGQGRRQSPSGILRLPSTDRTQQKGWNFMECIACQGDLSGSEITERYEDGNNEYAYRTCRHCGHKNDDYSRGGDDQPELLGTLYNTRGRQR